AGVLLPRLLCLVGGAAAARPLVRRGRPGGLGPAAGGARGRQRRAAHRGDVRRGGRVLHAALVGAVTRAERDRDAGMVEVAVPAGLTVVLGVAPAVGDDVRAQRGGLVHG